MADMYKWTDEDYFPQVEAGVKPVGNRILIQIRQVPKLTTGSGLILPNETRETEKAQTMIAKLIAVGPIAFKKRDSGEPWPEGVWASPGDLVRIPKWNADRFFVDNPADAGNPVTFGLCNDTELIAVVTGDHTKQRAYL